MNLPNINDEDQFALSVTGGVHLALLIIFLLYSFSFSKNMRPSFIEVQFGKFKTGTSAQYAKKKHKKVATNPHPSKVEPDEPKPKKPEVNKKPKTTKKQTTKPVDVPDQTEKIKEKPLKTPETDKVDPKKKTEKKQNEKVMVPPKTKKDEIKQKGAKNSGDKKGKTGKLDADQGTGNQNEKSSPYQLKWEGNINRTPRVKPLPDNTTDRQATIAIKFEVKPNGKVGKIIPQKKMNPELEQEVITKLRQWRFSHLPAKAPQESQWGIITFHFVVE